MGYEDATATEDVEYKCLTSQKTDTSEIVA